MEPVNQALQLLRRKEELERAMHEPGGVRIVEERELFSVLARLKEIPNAAKAVATS